MANMLTRRVHIFLALSLTLLGVGSIAAPAAAQDVAASAERAGQVAKSSVGQVGQRQTREQAATKINPMAAVNGRIQNRIENRLRTRIDRFYDPQANTSSPFTVAGERTRAPITRRR